MSSRNSHRIASWSFFFGLLVAASAVNTHLSAAGLNFALPNFTPQKLAPRRIVCTERGPGSSRSINIGKSWAGATGSISAGAKYRCNDCGVFKKSSRAYATAKVTAKLLKKSVKAFDARMTSTVSNGTAKAKLYVKIGKSVLINKTGRTVSWVKNRKITLISASYPIPVLSFISVRISAKLAAVLDANLKLVANAAQNLVQNSGHLTASLQGSATGGVDAIVASGGIEFSLNVLKATLKGTYGVRRCTPFGSLRVCFDPVKIRLYGFVKINKPCFPKFWKNCPKKYSKTLVRWNAKSYCKTLVRA